MSKNILITGASSGIGEAIARRLAKEVAGKLVMPAGAVYSGTKFFVRAFSEGLRQEMAMNKKKHTGN